VTKKVVEMSFVLCATSATKVSTYRLTGGGFGGCTVTLVKGDVDDLIEQLKKNDYNERTRKFCECF
jgi:galactokinase